MTLRAPFPYFGGKRRAAPIIWKALGDPGGYVEPFAGSAAVLLARPRFEGRRVETLNDADGWLVNMWRAVQLSPDQVARHAYGPVTEIDYHARLAWLQERRTDGLVSWLEGDPEAHDAKAAGWWLYVAACGIGDPWGPDRGGSSTDTCATPGNFPTSVTPDGASTGDFPTSATPDGASTGNFPTSATPDRAHSPTTCTHSHTASNESASPAETGAASSHHPPPAPPPAETGT